MSNKKTTQTNLSTAEKPTDAILQQPYTTLNHGSQTHMGSSSSEQHTHQLMSPISLFPTVEESVDEHEIADEYLTEKEQQQLLLDEEALRETLEEQARAEKERKERMRQEQTHDELFRLEFEVKSDSEDKSD
uniref:Uncharacterized protein n=1 Tax=Tanacetum cinerariifolium TaxID=118510 RepID=A0A6L2NK41_TANCI|nr:hypothetical protein [Tanacetum cinerariifolium]